MIEDSDILLVIPAIIAVIVSAVGIWRSNKITQKSNEILEKDFIIQHRPWVILSDPKLIEVFHMGGSVITGEDFLRLDEEERQSTTETRHYYQVVMKNIGSTPAYNLEGELRSGKILPEDFAGSIGYKQPLLPNEEKVIKIRMRFPPPEKGGFEDIIYGLRVTYQIYDHENNPKTQFITKIWEFRDYGKWIQKDYFIDDVKKKKLEED